MIHPPKNAWIPSFKTQLLVLVTQTKILSHEILKDALDTDAPIGEVFKCSVAEAVSAVEVAIGRLSGTS